MYLNLLFKSLKHDPEVERVKAFVKRFCQVLCGGFGGTEFVAGGLWLLGEVIVTDLCLAQPVHLLFPVVRFHARTEGRAEEASACLSAG